MADSTLIGSGAPINPGQATGDGLPSYNLNGIQSMLQSSSDPSVSSLYNFWNNAYTTNTNQAMTNLNKSYTAELGTLGGLNSQGLSDINQQYAASGANMNQDMTSRGLSGTTVQDTMQQSNTQQSVQAQNNWANQMAQMKLGVQQQYGNASSNLSMETAGLASSAAAFRPYNRQSSVVGGYGATGGSGNTGYATSPDYFNNEYYGLGLTSI